MSEKLKIKQLNVIASIRERRLEDVEREYNRAASEVKKAVKMEEQMKREVEEYIDYQKKRDEEINSEILSGVFKLEDIFLKKEEQDTIKGNLANKKTEEKEATHKRRLLEDELLCKKREYNKEFISLEKIKIFTESLEQ